MAFAAVTSCMEMFKSLKAAGPENDNSIVMHCNAFETSNGTDTALLKIVCIHANYTSQNI